MYINEVQDFRTLPFWQSRIMYNLFNIAKEVVPINRARVASCLVYKRKIISIGINQKKSSRLARKFNKNEFALYNHAEISCLNNADDDINFNKCILFICRAKKLAPHDIWNTGLSKPCEGCQSAIDFFNLKEVFYSGERCIIK